MKSEVNTRAKGRKKNIENGCITESVSGVYNMLFYVEIPEQYQMQNASYILMQMI